MRIKELNIGEFENFIKQNILGNYCQTYAYSKIMEYNNYNSLFLGLIDKSNNIIAATLILVKKLSLFYKYGYAPKGFIIDYSNKEILSIFTTKLKEYFKKQNIVFIKINPEIAIAEINSKTYEKDYNWNIEIKNYLTDLGYKKLKDNLYFEAKFPRYNGIIHLKKFSLDNTLKNTRNKIKRSFNKGLKIELANNYGLPILYEFIKRKKNKNIEFYREYLKYFSKKNIDLFLVSINTNNFLNNSKNLYDLELKHNNKCQNNLLNQKSEKGLNIKMNSDRKLLSYKNDLLEAQKKFNQSDKIYIAGALIVKYKNRINIIISGFDQKYRRFNPNYFLHYNIFEYYKRDYDFADINGLTGDFTKDNPYHGLNEFKLGFKPKVYEFIGEYDLILKPTIYKIMNKKGILAKILNKNKHKKN